MVYYSIVISTLHCIMDLFCDFHIDGVRQERERSSGLAAGCRRKVTVDEPLTPPDRITPMAPAEIRFASKLKAHVGEAGARCEAFRLTATPINVNASEVSIGDAAFTSETLCRSSVSFFAVAE